LSLRGATALVALCIASAVGGYSAYRWWQATPETTAARPDLVLQGLDGRAHRLSEWDGKLVLVNFWATWCTPCLKEIPLLVKAQKEHAGAGLQIVGVAMDRAEPVKLFVERLGMNYPIMVGEADVAAAMDALGDELGALPFSVLIGRDGRILRRVSGDLSPEELQELLQGQL